MFEREPHSPSASKVLVYCLVAVVGGIGCLATFGQKLWQVFLGVGLVFVAAWLLRVTKAAPNPSIERTRPGKPGRASHVKR